MKKLITIEGVDYDLDVDQATQSGLLKKKVVRHIGQRYQIHNEGSCFNGHTYLLCAGDDLKVYLMDLESGKRYSYGTKVEKADDITDEEWLVIGGNSFKLIS